MKPNVWCHDQREKRRVTISFAKVRASDKGFSEVRIKMSYYSLSNEKALSKRPLSYIIRSVWCPKWKHEVLSSIREYTVVNVGVLHDGMFVMPFAVEDEEHTNRN